MVRIDIHMQVERVEFQKLRDMHPGETSAAVRVLVEAARERQRGRFAGTTIDCNADMRLASSTAVASLGLTLCALIIFLHLKGLTPKPADRQP